MADRKEGRLASSEVGMAQSSVVFSRCFYCSSGGFYNWLDLEITDQDKGNFLKNHGTLCVCVCVCARALPSSLFSVHRSDLQ